MQVTDIPAVTAQVTEYQMMTRTCGGCGHATTAPAPQQVPAGVSGGTCYGQGVRATAAFLASSDVIGVARATVVLAALLGLDVSTGFVAACLARLDDALVAAGLQDAVKAGLRAAGVIGTDESPVRIAGAQADTGTGAGTRAEPAAAPAKAAGRQRRSRLVYLYTARTMNAYTCGPGLGRGDLLWYGAAASRSGATIDAFAILPGYRGSWSATTTAGTSSTTPTSKRCSCAWRTCCVT